MSKSKKVEIAKLKFYDTFEEVGYSGQELITTRWGASAERE